MFQKISLKIGQIIQAIEQPILVKVKLQGGLPTTYQKLDTPWFRSLQIDTVFDIGANLGQFTKTVHILLPHAKIYSFEPLPECFDCLQAFAKNKPNIQVFNLGIGDASGVLSFERNDFSPSSSFLKMTENHKQAFPFTEKSSTVDA